MKAAVKQLKTKKRGSGLFKVTTSKYRGIAVSDKPNTAAEAKGQNGIAVSSARSSVALATDHLGIAVITNEPSVASAQGPFGIAAALGEGCASASGDNGVAIACREGLACADHATATAVAVDVAARGVLGATLVLVDTVYRKSVVVRVDGETVEPDTLYRIGPVSGVPEAVC